MTNLILDTSTDRLLIALVQNSKLLDWADQPHLQNLSKSLLPSIEEMLRRNQITVKDLKTIAIGIGPGSYTGTRIGLAVAQSLALPFGIPIYPFCSLLAFIPALIPTEAFSFLVEAKPNRIFLLKGSYAKNQWGSLEHFILDKENLSSHLEESSIILSLSENLLETHAPFFPKTTPKQVAKLNLDPLISYISQLQTNPPQKAKIIYLQPIE